MRPLRSDRNYYSSVEVDIIFTISYLDWFDYVRTATLIRLSGLDFYPCILIILDSFGV